MKNKCLDHQLVQVVPSVADHRGKPPPPHHQWC